MVLAFPSGNDPSEIRGIPAKLSWRRRWLCQGVFQVSDQIGGVFEADRNTDGAWSDACEFQFLAAHIVMRAKNRKHHERFDTAKTGGEEKQLDPIAEFARRGKTTLQIKRQHGAKIFHLFFCQRVIRM